MCVYTSHVAQVGVVVLKVVLGPKCTFSKTRTLWNFYWVFFEWVFLLLQNSWQSNLKQSILNMYRPFVLFFDVNVLVVWVSDSKYLGLVSILILWSVSNVSVWVGRFNTSTVSRNGRASPLSESALKTTRCSLTVNALLFQTQGQRSRWSFDRACRSSPLSTLHPKETETNLCYLLQLRQSFWPLLTRDGFKAVLQTRQLAATFATWTQR